MSGYLRSWYWLCFLFGLLVFAFPIAWRSYAFFLILLLYPVGALMVLILMAYWLSQGWLRFRQVLLGLLPIILGGIFALRWDKAARDLIFAWNIPAYRRTVNKLIATPPPRDKVRIDEGDLAGFGVYSGNMETINGQLVITIHTCSGPTLETVAFSRRAIPELGEMKRMDDLGYWYYDKR